MKRFSDRYGFERSEVTLANWRESPFSRFAFSFVSEVVPSAFVPPSRHISGLKKTIDESGLDRDILAGGTTRTLREYLEYSQTDTLLLWRDGAIMSSTCSHPHTMLSPLRTVMPFCRVSSKGESI